MRGLFPLSADPITNGHLDLIARARAACDELIVAVLENDAKRGRYTFTLTERVAFVERAIRRLGLDVRVLASDHILLTDLYLREGCDVIFRGIRNSQDQDMEETQARLHAEILPEITGHFRFLPASPEFQDTSSTYVKAFVSHYVDVSRLVPVFVKQALEERINHQWLVGMTGPMASGKTTVAHTLAKQFHTMTQIPATVINLDALIRALYTETSAGADRVRTQIATLLGNDVLDEHGGLRRDVMARRLFDPACPTETREALNTLTTPHIMRLLREALRTTKGLVILEWALLVEMNLTRLTNNNVIVVDTPDRDAFLTTRGVSDEHRRNVGRHQFSATEQIAGAERAAERDGHGTVLHYINRRRDTPEAMAADVAALVPELVSLFPTLTREVLS